jgi:hypothetical protein
MTRHKTWHAMVVGGALLAAVALHAGRATGQIITVVQSSSPTYAILLKDGNTAIVWWDAVSDPAHPSWRCEVPAPRGGASDRTTTALTAAAGDWRAALAEARAILKDRVSTGE